jgi:hypothetical protein
MIAAIVKFDDDVDEEIARKVASEARGMFEGLPNLRSKAFTFDAKRNAPMNVYIWESEDAARAFFSDDLVERVTGLYGARPMVEFVEVLELVDNA